MLDACKMKLDGLCDTTLAFEQTLLPSLAPFDDNSFDSAMCNLVSSFFIGGKDGFRDLGTDGTQKPHSKQSHSKQLWSHSLYFDGNSQVVHHLEDDQTRPGWTNFATLVGEIARVLKPGGTMCFNHIAPEQVDAFWFLHYVPECRERWRSTLVSCDTMVEIMIAAGFSGISRTTPMDYVLFRPMDAYTNPRGPLSLSWRKSTSMWAVGEPDELAVALRRIAAENDTGEIAAVIANYELRRKEIGHTCFIYGKIPE